jgi:uncharacterized protein with PhoU and TrkA domain
MPRFEKVAYKPIPVRELLAEMKNLSELMIDLAYSAALFNDKELAEDVLALEVHIDNLGYQLGIEVMVASRGDPRDAEALEGVSRVAAATDKISDAAADIAAIVTRDIGVHPIVGSIFEKVEERLMKATVKQDSAIANKRIGKLDLAARGVDIIAIRRNKTWIINPKSSEHIFPGDTLITRGAPDGIKQFKDLAEGKNTQLEDRH